MPDEINAAEKVAAAAAAAPAGDTKPSDAVADAAKAAAAKSTEGESEKTLLTEGDGKKEGDSAASPEAEAKPEVPEKYEIKAPEGMEVKPEVIEAMSPVFKELKITQEGAQKLADAYAPFIQKAIEQERTAAVEAFKTMTADWKKETVEALGADHKKELANAARFIDKFGNDEVRKVLDDTGLGNNVHVAKLFIAAGKALGQDSFPDSGKKGGGTDTEADKADKLYPTMSQK